MSSSWIKNLLLLCRKLPIGLIYAYQLMVSPFLSPSCRFYPTCSHYACQAFQKYGLLKGGYLTVRRIAKCHPFHPGGYDPLV